MNQYNQENIEKQFLEKFKGISSDLSKIDTLKNKKQFKKLVTSKLSEKGETHHHHHHWRKKQDKIDSNLKSIERFIPSYLYEKLKKCS